MNSYVLTALARNNSPNSRFRITVYSDGILKSRTVNSGSIYVSSGGLISNITANLGASIYLSDRGIANSVTVNLTGRLYISSGGTANSPTVSGGALYVSSGGTANSTTVSLGGSMSISGTANYTTVNPGGALYVSSGGTATAIDAKGGAILHLTVASDTYIQGTFAGSAFLMENAFISGYTVNSYGRMYVSSGGTANSTTVNAGGLSVESGGYIFSAVISKYGSCYVSSGAYYQNIQSEISAIVSIYPGAISGAPPAN